MNVRTSPTAIWRAIVGPPLPTERLKHERLSNTQALAVFGSDAISSAAYGPEEILRALAPAGVAALTLATPIGGAIALLVLIVATSYYQTIHAYPSGGGAYIVARENLGVRAGLAAAAALLIDYVLTVAVSVSAGVTAITSAFQSISPYRLELALGFVLFVSVINLRGVRESGRVSSVPTYSFIIALIVTIAGAIVLKLTGQIQRPPAPPVESGVGDVARLTPLLVLRAFAAGTAALTGIEAVANGVGAFRQPEARNASRTLFAMALLLGLFVLGIVVVSRAMGVVPSEEESVISQMARGVFGESPLYYWVQLSTLAILLLAANTAFADFPRLAAILARDEYAPHQFANIGDRLVFANGIIALGLLSAGLITVFDASVHHLIPLYMVGVFLAFTLSQAGMVIHWVCHRGRWWKVKAAINLLGAIITGIVGLEVSVVKFAEGAWVTLAAIAVVMGGMQYVHRHYEVVRRLLAVDRARPVRTARQHKIIVPIPDVHRGVVEAVRYARAISDDVVALYVAVDPDKTDSVRERWERNVVGVPLVVLDSPYRSVVRPIVEYCERIERGFAGDTVMTVVIPEFITKHWWENILHNQTALLLELGLIYRRRKGRGRVVVARVPYYLAR